MAATAGTCSWHPMVNFINILRTRFFAFFAFLPKSFCRSQNITREKLGKALSYKKCASKMLMKLTLSVPRHRPGWEPLGSMKQCYAMERKSWKEKIWNKNWVVKLVVILIVQFISVSVYDFSQTFVNIQHWFVSQINLLFFLCCV